MPVTGDPIILFGDNKGSNALTANPEHHARTKHIDVKYHYIRQLVGDKEVDIRYIPTAAMAADILLTKPLTTKVFEEGRQLLGMYDCSHKYSKSPPAHEKAGDDSESITATCAPSPLSSAPVSIFPQDK